MLLREAIELIANFDHVREALHRQFTHVLVDDGQELALVQQRLLYFLAPLPEMGGPERSLVLAGDADSAIETFRGGDPEWMDDFEKEFGAHETVVLRTSYRLSPELGRQARSLIGRNGPRAHRMDAFAGEGTLEVNRYGSLAVEVESVARAIRMAHLTDGVPYEDMAILLTSPRSMLPPLERALDALEVPFSISAPDRPLAREPIVRSFTDLAIFAFAEQPDPEHMAQLLRSPLIDLDDAAVRELERVARVSGRSLPEVMDAGPHEDWDDQMPREDRAAHRTARSPPREEGLARGRSLLGRLGPVPVVRRSSGARSHQPGRSREPRSGRSGRLQSLTWSFRRAAPGRRYVR